MPDFGAQLGMQMASQAASGIFGIALGDINDKRQLRQQKKLQALQIRGQQEMTNYNYAKQLEMWKATSYQAQIEQLRKAGLNPGLLYGMSGGGGQVTGSGSGGNVTGSNAPTGGREVQDIMGMGIQYRLLEAQKANIEADTANKQADTEKTKGVDTELGKTQIQSLTQGIENAKAQKEMTEIQTSILQIEQHIKGSTQNAAIATILYEMKETFERMGIMINENIISDATVRDKADIIKAELIGIYLRNALTEAQKDKTRSDITVNEAQITKWIADVTQMATNLDRQERELILKKWEAEMKANYPGVWQVVGNAVKRIIDASDKISDKLFGEKRQIGEKNKPVPNIKPGL